MNYHQQQYTRNYSSLDRCSRTERSHDAEFDDFGFESRRFGSGRYVRNEFDVISGKQDNPDVVQFGNNASNTFNKRSCYDVDNCSATNTTTGPLTTNRVASEAYPNSESPGTCKGS